MLVSKKSDEIFASTLELIERNASREGFLHERQEVPVYGSFVVLPKLPASDADLSRVQNSNVKFNQMIVLNTTEQWTARLSTSEILHNKAVLYEFTPILTMKLRGKTYLTLGLTLGNVRSAYIQLATKCPLISKASMGMNYKFTAYKHRPTFVSMGCWVAANDGHATVELKSSIKSQASVTYKRPLSRSVTSYLRVIGYRHINQPHVQLGVDYTIDSFKLQAYASIKKSVVNVTLNAIFKLSDCWKTNIQAEVREDKVFINLGFQNQTFYFQLPILCQSAESLIDKLSLMFLGGFLVWTLYKINSQRPSVKNPGEEKLVGPKERLEHQKKMLGLMQQRIQENYKHEEECQGLIIVEAYYGKEEHIRELVRSVNRALYHLSHELEVVDVTLPLVFWTKGSQLHLFANSKKDVIGFCDPCLLEECRKQLLVRYRYQGVEHEVLIEDTVELTLP